MERLDRTIAGRLTIAVLAIHLLILPLLYFAVVFLVKQSSAEWFINNVRIHTRFIADSLELVNNVDDEDAIVDILDSAVLSGDGVFATLAGNHSEWTSSLVSDEPSLNYQEDFSIGEHGDDIYFLSVPVIIDKAEFTLQLGFSELPIVEANQQAYRRGAAILGAYLAVILALVALIGRRIVQPVKALQLSSQHIASGQLGESLQVETNLTEFVALARDLESMRNHLIGINQQLQEEIRQKEETELERAQLEQQLRHRQRLETVGTLAGGIAHELNNIMVPILLYAESAMDDLEEGHPVRKDLQRVMRAASRARGIVQQVLTFSRQMGSLDLHPVDVAVVIRESLDLVRASFLPTVDLHVDIDDHCPPVLGNGALLGQVVVNLCSNAYQALPEGQGRIAVSLRRALIDADRPGVDRRLKSGEYAVFTVEDTGAGMSEQTRQRIFEPFFTTRKVGDGTGLGLSVVHGIVSNMEGEIVVTTEPGHGTSFVVYIPAIESQVTSV
jgi:signal transduction histidine kinase